MVLLDNHNDSDAKRKIRLSKESGCEEGGANHEQYRLHDHGALLPGTGEVGASKSEQMDCASRTVARARARARRVALAEETASAGDARRSHDNPAELASSL